MTGVNSVESFDKLKSIVARLRAEDGCPWDREQTHASLKPECIEEAAEVVCGINVLEATGNPENLKEELGDLLLQVMMHAQIAEEEGLFTMVSGSDEVLVNWEQIKAAEKIGKAPEAEYLPQAFDESIGLIHAAKKRKGYEQEAGKP